VTTLVDSEPDDRTLAVELVRELTRKEVMGGDLRVESKIRSEDLFLDEEVE
jgi:hypothetical protein